MPATTATDQMELFRRFITAQVRKEGPDLSSRQMAVFLTCYLENEAQTVRGLASALSVSKPAITRALDRLSEFDLVRRKTDPMDRRSVLVQRTATGMAYVREMRHDLIELTNELANEPPENTSRTSTRGSDRKKATHPAT